MPGIPISPASLGAKGWRHTGHPPQGGKWRGGVEQGTRWEGGALPTGSFPWENRSVLRPPSPYVLSSTASCPSASSLPGVPADLRMSPQARNCASHSRALVTLSHLPPRLASLHMALRLSHGGLLPPLPTSGSHRPGETSSFRYLDDSAVPTQLMGDTGSRRKPSEPRPHLWECEHVWKKASCICNKES